MTRPLLLAAATAAAFAAGVVFERLHSRRELADVGGEVGQHDAPLSSELKRLLEQLQDDTDYQRISARISALAALVGHGPSVGDKS